VQPVGGGDRFFEGGVGGWGGGGLHYCCRFGNRFGQGRLGTGLGGGSLAISLTELDGGVLAGETEVAVGMVDDVLVATLAAVTRQEARAVVVTV